MTFAGIDRAGQKYHYKKVLYIYHYQKVLYFNRKILSNERAPTACDFDRAWRLWQRREYKTGVF